MKPTGKADPEVSPRVLNIGIYGCTRAGKTRFLFELLRHWEQSRRILVASAPCQQFLKTVEGEIEKHGDSMPTAAVSPEITVTVDHPGKEPPWQVTFRDLRGELLTDELDGIETLARAGMMSSQVKECDAFLFLFDPAASTPEAAMEQHHEHELRRAELFITYVRDQRQNHLMPIAFVQTHADIWGRDEELSAAASKWCSRVHEILTTQYKRLRGHFPPCLTDVDRIFFETAAAEASDQARGKLEAVVEQLYDAKRAIEVFQQRDRRRQRTIAAAAAAMVLSLVSVVAWMSIFPPSPTRPGHSSRPGESVPRERPKTDKEALKIARDFRTFVAQLPTGVQVPDASDASRISSELQWLCSECDPTQSTTSARPANVRDSLVEVLREASQYLLTLANRSDVSADKRYSFLSTCLKEVPDGAAVGVQELTDSQQAIWSLANADLASDLAAILRRRRDVASPVIQAIEEIAAELSKRKTEWGGNGIARTPGQSVIDRLDDALTFCEDRKKSGTYNATIRVEASQTLGGDSPLTPRVLRISTPGRGSTTQTENIGLIPNDGRVPLDITPEVNWGRDCWDGYDNKVVLACESKEHTNKSITSRPRKTSVLETVRIAPHQQDQVEINAYIRVTDDKYFYWSSTKHGQGTLQCTVRDLLQSPQTLRLHGTGANGNAIVFRATTSDPKQRSGFHTGRTEYPVTFGLGAPIECRVYLETDSSRDRHSFDAAKDPGPLAALGLPLLRDRQKPEAKYVHEQDGFTIEVRFTSLPVVPAVLWDAALLAKENRHE
jgi:hypothetical protein